MARRSGPQRQLAQHPRRRARARPDAARTRAMPGVGAPGADVGDHGSAYQYDARRPPPRGPWLALGEQARLDAVAAYHERALPPDQLPPSLALHASLHVAVENQLARGEPPGAVQALHRLLASGMSRHDAVHAIGWVAVDHCKRALARRQPVDERAYAQDLAQLSRESWLAAAGERPPSVAAAPVRGGGGERPAGGRRVRPR